MHHIWAIALLAVSCTANPVKNKRAPKGKENISPLPQPGHEGSASSSSATTAPRPSLSASTPAAHHFTVGNGEHHAWPGAIVSPGLQQHLAKSKDAGVYANTEDGKKILETVKHENPELDEVERVALRRGPHNKTPDGPYHVTATTQTAEQKINNTSTAMHVPVMQNPADLTAWALDRGRPLEQWPVNHAYRQQSKSKSASRGQSGGSRPASKKRGARAVAHRGRSLTPRKGSRGGTQQLEQPATDQAGASGSKIPGVHYDEHGNPTPAFPPNSNNDNFSKDLHPGNSEHCGAPVGCDSTI